MACAMVSQISIQCAQPHCLETVLRQNTTVYARAQPSLISQEPGNRKGQGQSPSVLQGKTSMASFQLGPIFSPFQLLPVPPMAQEQTFNTQAFKGHLR